MFLNLSRRASQTGPVMSVTQDAKKNGLPVGLHGMLQSVQKIHVNTSGCFWGEL